METMNNVQSRSNSNYNFYTANGWAGKNYNSSLSGKDIAKNIREFIKKEYPDYKFSVRYRFGIQADSIYITLLSGPIPAFIDGSRAAIRGYIETMNNFGDHYKDEILPDILRLMDSVSSYALSFRYDDSDGMIDYFDTNFYLNLAIGNFDHNYTILKPNKSNQTPASNKLDDSSLSTHDLEMIEYSEKSIAVFGDTKSIKEELKALGGKFNPALKNNGEKRAGWIFPKKQADKVRALLAPAACVDPETSQTLKTKEEEVQPVVEHYFVKKKTDLEQLIESGDLDSINEMIKQKEEAFNNAMENVNYNKEINNIEFMENEEVRAGRLQRDLELLKTAIKETSNTKNMDSPAYGDSETPQTLEQEEQEKENRIWERFPLEGVTVEENTTGPNGVVYFTVEGAGPVTEARVRADLKPGDTFNVCTKDGRKYGVTYDGVSLNRSIWDELPGIVEYEEKYYPEDCPTDADGNRFYSDTREDYAPFPYVVVDRLDGSVWFFTDSEDEAKEWAADYNQEYCEGGKRREQPGVEHEVTRTDPARCAG